MIITNTIDTDLIVLSYVEPSILAYIKIINSDFYKLIKDIITNNNIFKLTKALINTPHFLENYFDNFIIGKSELLNMCVKHELDLDGLKWLYYTKKCKPNGNTFMYAAKNDNFDILKWMFDNHFPINERSFMYIAKNGNFNSLKWLFNNNFPNNKFTFAFAAQNGNLDILKWMLENNFSKDESTFTFAVRNGNLDNLKWMLENNFSYLDNDFDSFIELCKKANTEP